MQPKTRSNVLQSFCSTSEIFHEYNYCKWHLQKIYDHGKKKFGELSRKKGRNFLTSYFSSRSLIIFCLTSMTVTYIFYH